VHSIFPAVIPQSVASCIRASGEFRAGSDGHPCEPGADDSVRSHRPFPSRPIGIGSAELKSDPEVSRRKALAIDNPGMDAKTAHGRTNHDLLIQVSGLPSKNADSDRAYVLRSCPLRCSGILQAGDLHRNCQPDSSLESARSNGHFGSTSPTADQRKHKGLDRSCSQQELPAAPRT
jgi:hypothetical protein